MGSQTIVGSSEATREVRSRIRRASRARATVLITGETGVGKELVARAIHEGGVTEGGPWVPVNCAALPGDLVESLLFGHVRGAFTGADRASKGKFREAHGGTLFLDEVGELPLAAQAKLLRVLQERLVEPIGGSPVEVRVRVVAATHRDLEREVEAGRFREDLRFRLSVIRVDVPPLRDRPEDLPALIKGLVQRVAERVELPAPRVSRSLAPYLASYSWPGNVRELENLIEECLVMEEAEVLSPETLPRDFRKRAFLEDFVPGPVTSAQEEPEDPDQEAGRNRVQAPLLPSDAGLREQVDAFEKEVLLDALARAGGRKKDAAAALGISPRAMSHYVRKHGLD